MRSLLAIGLLSLSVAVYANGEGPPDGNRGFCNGPGDDCNKIITTNEGGDGGDAYANSRAYAEGGDAYQKQTAYGGSAYQGQDQDQDQFQIGINKQDQDQDQDQYQKAIAAQLQKASADNEGNQQNLSITSYAKVEAEPAIAPAVAPGDPTAPCYSTWGGSAAGGGVVSFGLSGSTYDVICGGLEFYRTTAGDSSDEVRAMRSATIAATYALLQKKIESELGGEAYAAAVGIEPRDEDVKSASFIQASLRTDGN